MQNNFSLYLGPLLGFLFTAGTLLFVAMNAHRTLPTEDTAVAAAEAGEPVPPTLVVETPASVAPEAVSEEQTREGT